MNNLRIHNYLGLPPPRPSNHKTLIASQESSDQQNGHLRDEQNVRAKLISGRRRHKAGSQTKRDTFGQLLWAKQDKAGLAADGLIHSCQSRKLRGTSIFRGGISVGIVCWGLRAWAHLNALGLFLSTER